MRQSCLPRISSYYLQVADDVTSSCGMSRVESRSRAAKILSEESGLIAESYGDELQGVTRVCDGSWTAFVDESEPDPRNDPGVYLLAAVLAEHSQLEQVGEVLRSLLLPGQRKLHWHGESEPRRKLLASTLAELDVLHMVVVRTGGPAGERSERRRRLCLRRLLHELEVAGATRVVLEARQRKQNQADRSLLDALRAQKKLAATLHMEHVPGPENPVLAAADIVCGAVTADRQGEHGYLAPLKPLLSMYTIGASDKG